MDGWEIAVIVICLKLIIVAFCLCYRYKARKNYEKRRFQEENDVQRANQQMINWIEVQNQHSSQNEDFQSPVSY